MRGTPLVVLLGIAALAGAIVLYGYDPATSAIFPPCPFHALSGLHCPGCGALRAFHALLHGEPGRAVALNPLVTLAAPLLLLGTAREAYRLAYGEDRVRARIPAWSIYAVLTLIVSFGILRNLPGLGWLAPH